MIQNYITVVELEKQCNIDNPTDSDVSYLESLLDTSVTTVENKIQQKLADVLIDGILPAPLKQAMLLIAANLYANREPVAYGVPQRIPYTLDYLIQPYIKYT
jgi:hypothetical protein